jgi:2,4-dienoyl-CoA reductase-like NADH-dependent reductase (Old Yellow Enzyme family)
MGIQLAHAGRKASTARTWLGGRAVADADGGWAPLGPTDDAFSPNHRQPRAMSAADIARLISAFGQAARRAHRIGMDVIELHAAHGYLLNSFLSPLANRRADDYGGPFENRTRLLLEVVDAVRGEWPAGKPLFVRISAVDWIEGGWEIADSVRLARLLKVRGVDVIDCSSGGVAAGASIPVRPGYQVPFAEQVRREAGVATAAVGLITEAAQAEEILERRQADLICMARELLRDPYFPMHAAAELDAAQAVPWPKPYWRAVERG